MHCSVLSFIKRAQNLLFLASAQDEVLGDGVVLGGEPHDVPHVLGGRHREMLICV